MADKNLKFEVIKDYGTFGEGAWSKHLALVSWNGREPKLDIRPWNEDMTVPGKGITLTKEEVFDLQNLLEEVFE